MSLPVILDPEARDEFDEAYDYYERLRAGMGAKFADAVQNVFARIAAMPRLHQKVLGMSGERSFNDFPFASIIAKNQPLSASCRSFTLGAIRPFGKLALLHEFPGPSMIEKPRSPRLPIE